MLNADFDFKRFQSSSLQQAGEEREIKIGLKKFILKAGQGWETPNTLDVVKVHYSGMLDDGTAFDSSHEVGNCPFIFSLGQGDVFIYICFKFISWRLAGHVIRGLDIGISSMRKGENALFTVPPEFAYGTSGLGSIVPPNATLKFKVELLSWDSIKDVCRDGGILKKVVADGHKWETPNDADEVCVKFDARLESGDFVYRSPDDGVEFYVKDGHFCLAISKIVKTMKRGEKATAIVRPQYAFGEKGCREFAVPPSKNLVIDIELITWKVVEDITQNGKLIKKILQPGEGYERPSDGSVVRVNYSGKLEDGTVFDHQNAFEFVIDEEQINPASLEKAVCKMTKGEVALITIAPEYGFAGSWTQQQFAVVPSNSVLMYQVELLSFVKEKEIWDMDGPERLQFARQKKERGNSLFKGGKYFQASKRYTKAAKVLEHNELLNVEERKVARALKMNSDLNNAACKLKLKDYKEAANLCTKVLQVDSHNIKALYRRAQAYIETADLELAELDLKKAMELDPKNRELRIEQKRLKHRKAEYNKKEARMYGNMFSRLSVGSSQEVSFGFMFSNVL